jgi:pimeloyl-ACP methyl ester carboxylesterase
MTLTHISTGGGQLAVEITGPSNGPLIICSPGMGDLRDSYSKLAAQLSSAGYRVACVDLRGHGNSSATFTKYGDDAVAEDYISTIQHLGGQRAVLCGASLSAGGAVIAAARHPELVAGLVLLGPFLRASGGGAMQALLQVLFWRPWGPMVWKAYAATLWPGLGAQGAKERAAQSAAMLSRPGRWAAFQATVAGADHDVAVKPFLGKSKAPALVVMGDRDPDWTDRKGEADWVAEHYGEARGEVCMVEGAGHAPHFERAEVVGEKVVGFLKRIQF